MIEPWALSTARLTMFSEAISSISWRWRPSSSRMAPKISGSRSSSGVVKKPSIWLGMAVAVAMERKPCVWDIEARALAQFKFYCHFPACDVRMAGDDKWPWNDKAGQRAATGPSGSGFEKADKNADRDHHRRAVDCFRVVVAPGGGLGWAHREEGRFR